MQIITLNGIEEKVIETAFVIVLYFLNFQGNRIATFLSKNKKCNNFKSWSEIKKSQQMILGNLL